MLILEGLTKRWAITLEQHFLCAEHKKNEVLINVSVDAS